MRALEAANDPDAEDPVERLMEMAMLSAYLDSGLAAFDLAAARASARSTERVRRGTATRRSAPEAPTRSWPSR